MDTSKVYDYDPRKLPQELLAAIGLAIASAGQTESVVADAIGAFAGSDIFCSLAITTHMAPKLKLDALGSLLEVQISDPEILADFDDHLAHIDTLFGMRNALAHDRWCRDPDTGEIYRIALSARGQINIRPVPTTVQDIRAHAAAMYQAGMHLQEMLVLAGFEPKFPADIRPPAHQTRDARRAFRKARLKASK